MVSSTRERLELSSRDAIPEDWSSTLGSVFHERPNGFTLVELMIAIAILGVLAAVSLPNVSPLLARGRLNGAASQVLGDLRAARMQAVSQSRRVQLFFLDPWHYQICDDANDDGTVDVCEGTAHTKDLDTRYGGVGLASSANPLFTSKGTVAGRTTITLTNASGSKTVILEITGHVSIQ
jgi:prepilin-type N-terminal cleavage/methylation domain-containing protein